MLLPSGFQVLLLHLFLESSPFGGFISNFPLTSYALLRNTEVNK